MSEIRARKKRARGTQIQNLRGPDKQRVSAEVAEKRKLALDLRKQGATYEQIAKQLGLSTKMVAHRYVHDAIKDIPADAAREVKRLELEKLNARELRLNQLLLRIEDRRDKYDALVKAGKRGPEDNVGLFVVEQTRIESALTKLAERRARLEGLDAPLRAEVTGKDGGPVLTFTDIQGLTDEQLDRAIEARRRAGANGAGARAPAPAPGAPRPPH